jgi:hypothetical protein
VARAFEVIDIKMLYRLARGLLLTSRADVAIVALMMSGVHKLRGDPRVKTQAAGQNSGKRWQRVSGATRK